MSNRFKAESDDWRRRAKNRHIGAYVEHSISLGWVRTLMVACAIACFIFCLISVFYKPEAPVIKEEFKPLEYKPLLGRDVNHPSEIRARETFEKINAYQRERNETRKIRHNIATKAVPVLYFVLGVGFALCGLLAGRGPVVACFIGLACYLAFKLTLILHGKAPVKLMAMMVIIFGSTFWMALKDAIEFKRRMRREAARVKHREQKEMEDYGEEG